MVYFVRGFFLLKLLLLASPGVAKNATRSLENSRREVLSELRTVPPEILFKRTLFTETDSRIVGGKEAKDGRYSYAVSLIDVIFDSYGNIQTLAHFCGGSLITKDIVLTAAHCIEGRLNAGFSLLAADIGKNDRFNDYDGDVVTISSYSIHPNWGFNELFFEMDYDVALVYLDRATTVNVKPVELNQDDSFPTSGSVAHVVGWGQTSPTSASSPVLLEVGLEVISNEDCMIAGEGTYSSQITDNMMCTFSEGKDACMGDSGGPLIIRGTDSMGADDLQIGIVSFGPKSCADEPGVYTKVSRVYDWVKSHVCDRNNPPQRFSCGAPNPAPKPTTRQPTRKPVSKQPTPRPTPPPQQPTQEASEDRYSYAVSLLKVVDGNGYHFCGGSLIAKDVILTAGHCVEDIDKNVDVVVALVGRHEFGDSDGEVVQVNFEMSISHPFYNNLFADEFEYDFALLYLAVPTNANVKIVKLNQEVRFPKGFSTAYALGWGSVGLNLFNDDDSLVNLSQSLQEVEQTVIINAACRTTKNTVTIDGEQIEDSWEDKISDHMLCTLPSAGSGSDACTGDGGGPLVILGSDSMGGEDIQVGVASWGLLFCGLAPNVYSRVSSAYSWIKADICQYSQAPPEYLCETPSPTPRPTTRRPTPNPTNQPSPSPTNQPMRQPSHMPTSQPTRQPTLEPTNLPTNAPSAPPTDSLRPSESPSLGTSQSPSHVPSFDPSVSPEPSFPPSSVPSSSFKPTSIPSFSPSKFPSMGPSLSALQPFSTSSIPTTIFQPLSKPSSLQSPFPASNRTNTTTGEENAPPQDAVAGDSILIDSSEIVIDSEKPLEEDMGVASASVSSGVTARSFSEDGGIIVGMIALWNFVI